MALFDSGIEHRARCELIIGPGVVRKDENKLPDTTVDISGLVKHARFRKTLAQPNGTLEVTLPFASLREAVAAFPGAGPLPDASANMVIVPENTFRLSFDAGVVGSEMTTVARGTFSKIYERRTFSEDGSPQLEISLAGEDWGKLLVHHELPAHLFTTFTWGALEFEQRTGTTLLQGTVYDTVSQLWAFVFEKPLGVVLDARNLFALDVDPVLQERERGYIFCDSVWTRQGKFWNELRGLADEPWNEIWADYDQAVASPNHDKFVVHVRPRPFDEDLWAKLPAWVLRDDEIKYIDVALADDERINWVMVPPSGTMRANTDFSLDYVAYRTRRFDPQSAAAHGARLLKRSSAYFDFPGGPSSSLQNSSEAQRELMRGEGQLFANLDSRARRLWDWHSINHRLRRGTIIINGRPEIQIATRAENQRDASASFVKEEDERRSYYIEEVVHDYDNSGRFHTHLGVTRGQPVDAFIRPAVDGLADDAAYRVTS